MKSKAVPMVVITERGVFFGYGAPNLEAQHVRLTEARMVVYWSADCRSVVDLAANGPTNSCKIGPKAPAILKGPLKLCLDGTLHATFHPEKWKGDRWWAVAMYGEIVIDDNKIGALKR